ncbi:serine/threonine-protein kinase [Micromonospora sp. PLK6-60]|uniref:serine/threonine-protein kinase n=1 Tax=Micromonospora sp. PLK6-60 TaxID=2873383 RepID=UPI002107CDE0|nr:serine/threonine-protein kinase [Micromonospora sp. PLK6-60]
MRLLAGRYRLMEQVGQGGSAVVWRAVDELLGRIVAVKLLAGRGVEDRAWRDAVRAEARAAARLNHPNVAAVYDYGEARTAGLRRLPFLVLEYVDGENLAERLRRTGPLHWREAVRICGDLAIGIAAVHDAGLVHRDVKPGNVLLAPAGPKLVDLGVARAVGAATVNGRGEILGTPAYMAPEQLRGEPAVPASDIYAFGLLLAQCLTGRVPRDGDGDELAGSLAAAGLPDWVGELLRRCLAAEPDVRPTARTVARRLARTAPAGPWRLRPSAAAVAPPTAPAMLTVPAARRRPVRRAVLVGGVPAVLAGAVLAAQLPGFTSTRDAAEGATQASEPAARGCTVAYAAQRAVDGTFAAEITVEATGAQPAGQRVLSFRFPPGQRLGAPQDRWQSGQQVRIPLPAGATAEVRVPLRGTYTGGAGAAAEGFALAGVPCRNSSALVTVAGADGSSATAGQLPAPGGGGAAPGDAPRRPDTVAPAPAGGSAGEGARRSTPAGEPTRGSAPPSPPRPSGDAGATPTGGASSPRPTTAAPPPPEDPAPSTAPTTPPAPAPEPPETTKPTPPADESSAPADAPAADPAD